MKPGFYWIMDLNSSEGVEIGRLAGDLFFITRSDGDGEIIAVPNHPEYVRIISGPLEEPFY